MERFGITPYTRAFKRFSVRTIFMFVIAAFGAALLWATLFAQPTHAQGATADWNGASLQYNGRQYVESGKAKRNEFPGISENAPYFMASGASNNGGGLQSGSADRDVYIIYFTPGVDPPSEKSAQHVKFTFSPKTKTYSNPSEKSSIAIQGSYGQNATTCAIEGIGWMVCQVSSFLATGMDWVFEAISGFMEVQPLSTSQDSGLYVGWNVMRNIANIAFIIAFLIIVYAQLTGTFAGTYGIKKLLPRLIIAAILVNLSYIICAIAVDLSNIIGYSLQNVFIELRNQIFHIDNATWNQEYMGNWQSITGLILSGGTAGAAGLLALKSGIAFGPGAIYFLLPVLIGLLVAILVVLLVLAARQAIITIMILLAPLAFVAFLLPNTEKWFEKWRSLFMTMLIFFPAFAVVFGGSQLAGAIIIQNASSINVVILGMIVQVAPLVITPFLLKFSGSLLGRIAGLVNNPNKGIIDRSRRFAESRAAHTRDKWHGNQKMLGGAPRDKKLSAARRLSRFAASGQRKFDARAANSKMAADNSWHSSSAYQKIHDNSSLIETDRDTIDARNNAHTEKLKARPGSRLSVATKVLETEKQGLEANKVRTTAMIEKLRADESSELHMNTLRTKAGEATVDQLNNQNARMMEEYKSGKLVRTGEKDALMREMKEATIQSAAEKQGSVSAQYEIQRAISDAMNAESIAGESLRKIAAGVSGQVGETRARANAVSTLNKLDADVLKSNMDLLKANARQNGTTVKNFSAEIVENVGKGTNTIMVNGQATNINEDQFRAALQLQAEEKNMSLFEKMRGSTHVDQSIVSEIIADNIGNFKAAGGFHLQADPNLNVQVHGANFETELAKARVATLGNVGADNLAGLKAGWVADFAEANNLKQNLEAAHNAGDKKSLLNAYMGVKRALTTPDILARLNDREQELRDIEAALAKILGETPTEDPRPQI